MHKATQGNFSDTIHGLAGIWKGKSLNALGSICSLKMFREPKLPLKLALGIAIFMPVIYWWYSMKGINIPFEAGSIKYSSSNLTWQSKTESNVFEDATRSSVTDGLRMVVFGGGDVATPALSARKWNAQACEWTEIMCRKLGCDTYLSFVPQTDGMGGAVMSNQFVDGAYKRVSASSVVLNQDDNTVKLDYSWIPEQYPKPYQHDLAAQIDYFLASSQAHRASTGSLWVFNVGYWDIWYLTALPRKLATEVLDSSIRDLFFQIERLYQATQGRKLVTSPWPSHTHPSDPTDTGSKAGDTPRAPFRIFLTRVFDISLTPGFASTRPSPPRPHSTTTQLRNAAFLTKYWNALLEASAKEWLATSDPEDWPVTDKIDIQVIEATVGKHPLGKTEGSKKGKGKAKGKKENEGEKDNGRNRSSQGSDGNFTLPRRRLASYGLASYLQELMIDRQLRNTDLFDHNGLGAGPPEDGFIDITMPCVLKVAGHGIAKGGEVGDAGREISVCQDPDNYLFYTEFTVSPRAIHEIGVRAARGFLDQVEESSAWRERNGTFVESVREQSGRKMTETGA
ncbi:hypothetical protein F5Y07DRAFT_412302 [Xylaria sp. FL0933]|nr:hypothetical protein F5Y07DRAFT_412302 [Xylaria sp. FL0933]